MSFKRYYISGYGVAQSGGNNMPKTENNVTKTEVLHFRVTPQTKLRLDNKKGNKPQSDALSEALNMYLSDDNNLLEQIINNVDFTTNSKDDYQELRSLYLTAHGLYADFSKFESNHRQFKVNVWKNVFRDFLLPSLEKPIYDYESKHNVDDPITD